MHINAAVAFHYVITAQGTSTVVTHPPQSFNYTVTGSATETWTEVVDEPQETKYEVRNTKYGTTIDTFSLIPTLGGKGSVRYSLVGKPGSIHSRGVASWMSLTVNGSGICSFRTASDGKGVSGTFPFTVVADMTYELTLGTGGLVNEGRASATITLPARVEKVCTEARTATDSRQAQVTALDGEKEIAPVGVKAYPRAQREGALSNVTFQMVDDSSTVVTWIGNGAVFASTEQVGTTQVLWTAAQSGTGHVEVTGEVALIATSDLTAPEEDTEWSVSDDSPEVETWMDGNKLFAKLASATPPPKAALAIRSPTEGYVQVTLAGPTGQTYRIEYSPDLRVWEPVGIFSIEHERVVLVLKAIPGRSGFYRAKEADLEVPLSGGRPDGN